MTFHSRPSATRALLVVLLSIVVCGCAGKATSPPLALFDASGIAPAIIDNSSLGYSESGVGWTQQAYPPYASFFYGDDYRTTNTDGASATFEFTGLTAGEAYFPAWHWGAREFFSTAALVTVHDSDGKILFQSTQDQTVRPGSFNSAGFDWQYLGSYRPSGTNLKIKIGGATPNGVIAADAAFLSTFKPLPYDFVSRQSGSSASADTWFEGVPSDGATWFVSPGHTITIPANDKPIVGNGSNARCLSCERGTLIVDGASLTLRSPSQFGPERDTDSALVDRLICRSAFNVIFDGNAGVTPTCTLGSGGRAKFLGAPTSRGSVRTKAGTPGNPGAVDNDDSFTYARTRQAAVIADYVDFRNLGGAIAPALVTRNNAGETGAITNCTFDACGRVIVADEGDGRGIFRFNDNTVRRPLDTTNITPLDLSTGHALTTGTRELLRNRFFDGPAILYGKTDYTIENNYFAGGLASDRTSAKWKSFRNNLIERHALEIQLGGDAHDNMILWDSSINNGNAIALVPYHGGLFAGNVGQMISTGSINQRMFAASQHAGTTNPVAHITNNVVLPSADGGCSASLFQAFVESNEIAHVQDYVEHNTWWAGRAVASMTVYTDNATPHQKDMYLSLRSNIAFNPGDALTDVFLNRRATANPDCNVVDQLAAANCDYNARLGVGGYDTPMSDPAAAGVHDFVNVDPQFVDPSRDLRTWDASLGGAGTFDSARDRIAANPLLIPDAIAWIKDGWKVQNPALLHAGHDGATVGAMPHVSEAAPQPQPQPQPQPTPAPQQIQFGSSGTASSSGTAAGNLTPSYDIAAIFSKPPYFSEFKRDVRSDAVDPDSDRLMGQWGQYGAKLHVDFSATGDGTTQNGLYGLPINIVPSDTPLVPIKYGWDGGFMNYPPSLSDAGPMVPIPDHGLSFEGRPPSDNPPTGPLASGGDSHLLLLVRDKASGAIVKGYEFYQIWKTAAGWVCEVGRVFNFDTGVGPPDGLSGPDAAGMMMAPIVLKFDDVARGDIGHAIRATFPAGFFIPAKQVWPAMCAVSTSGFGMRIRLKADYDISAYSGQARVILEGMKKYGVINADITGVGLAYGPFISGVTDDRWDADSTTHGIFALQNVPVTAFEVVKIQPQYKVTGPTSGAVGAWAGFTVSKVPLDQQNYAGNVYISIKRPDSTAFVTLDPPTAASLSPSTPSINFGFWATVPGQYRLRFNHGNQLWKDCEDFVFTATGTAPPNPAPTPVPPPTPTPPATNPDRDKLTAIRDDLNAYLGTPVTPPSPPPALTFIDAPNGQFTDASGAVWTWDPTKGPAGYPILRNGVSTRGAAIRLVPKDGKLYALNAFIQWFVWTGTAWQSASDPTK